MQCFGDSAAQNRAGAALIASASGKLSEGINFSDNLARAVIMIGCKFGRKNAATKRVEFFSAVSKRTPSGNKTSSRGFVRIYWCKLTSGILFLVCRSAKAVHKRLRASRANLYARRRAMYGPSDSARSRLCRAFLR